VQACGTRVASLDREVETAAHASPVWPVIEALIVSCPANKLDMKSPGCPPCVVARRCHRYGYGASSRLA
ncbi:hypothetical protein, partial [Cupriavidus necator]|uniref:hypothetical protein n=1 Tax=Cupriavidus necator TaxID=106590 RepID=UPI00339D944A